MCETKVCSICKEEKSLTLFPKRTGPKPSYDPIKKVRNECRSCYNKRQIEGRIIRKEPGYVKPSLENLPDPVPYCPHCHTLKTWDDFNRSKQTRSGYHAWCRICVQEETRLRNAIPEVKKRRKEKYEENPIRTLLYGAKCRALSKNQEFTVTEEELTMPQVCPILGVVMKPGTPYAPTLDRIDNTKSYVAGNVWVISRKANTMKNDATLKGWRIFCENSLKFIRDNNL